MRAGRCFSIRFRTDSILLSPRIKVIIDPIMIPPIPPTAIPSRNTWLRIVVIIDPLSMFTGKADGVRIASITDGTSNTLLVTESKTPVPWTQPEGLTLDSGRPELDMGSRHPGGWNVLMADGSVRFFKTSVINEQMLKALATRNGGEVVSPP